jgi:hypothetical protein
VFFPLLQVTMTLTASVGRQRRKKGSWSTGFVAFIGNCAWTHALPMAVARGATHHYCFCKFRGLSNTVLGFLGVHFVNSKLFNVFWLFWILIDL